jgi:hypothetical protein
VSLDPGLLGVCGRSGRESARATGQSSVLGAWRAGDTFPWVGTGFVAWELAPEVHIQSFTSAAHVEIGPFTAPMWTSAGDIIAYPKSSHRGQGTTLYVDLITQ